MNELARNRQVVFGIAKEGQGDGVPVVLLGIPKGAWEWMKDGRTHTFDLTKVGMPIKIIMYGAKNHAQALSMLQQGSNAAGSPVENRLDDDFSIKPMGEEP